MKTWAAVLTTPRIPISRPQSGRAMRTYVVKRLILFIPTLVIVTVLVFGILRVVPGDPAMLILGDREELCGPM